MSHSPLLPEECMLLAVPHWDVFYLNGFRGADSTPVFFLGIAEYLLRIKHSLARQYETGPGFQHQILWPAKNALRLLRYALLNAMFDISARNEPTKIVVREAERAQIADFQSKLPDIPPELHREFVRFQQLLKRYLETIFCL